MHIQSSARQALREKAWQVPLRLATGAYLLNSGVSKGTADEPTTAQLQGFASGSYPFVNKMDPKQFTSALSITEAVIGSALLAPVVPSVVAGAGLTAFAGGLLGLYLRTPGMREPGSLRPTQDGIPLAKDTWLAAIGIALMIGCRSTRS